MKLIGKGAKRQAGSGSEGKGLQLHLAASLGGPEGYSGFSAKENIFKISSPGRGSKGIAKKERKNNGGGGGGGGAILMIFKGWGRMLEKT